MRKSKIIKIGNTKIGGGTPILVQSMLNAPADNIKANLAQLDELIKAGCEIIRMAVPDKNAIPAFSKVCEHS
ncbi:MAG: flavodoxin-dependent (E)-4-hydroxy-3-methylbut-2-enyl-diphosphate synthase, partial [Clostridiales bacterium]|nr:flavodoxin-dependent (E)-4-hydroxy-3-methylbut-2-enyl-diphosphate synthase [Clostridiales bacterium]